MATIAINVPATITITNKGKKAHGFVPYRENFVVTIPVGDAVTLKALTAGEVFYYLAQAEDDFTVTQAAAE